MSAAQIAFTGAAVLFALVVGLTVGLRRAVTANHLLAAQLHTCQTALTTALRLCATGVRATDIPRQRKDDYR